MTRQTERCIKELERLGERVVIGITLEVTSELIENTPVDTGWARANWVPSLGAPDTTRRTNRPTSAIVPGAVAAQQAGLAAVAAGFKFGGTTHVANAVPYIVKLNGGSSTQAPAGFVDRSIEKAVVTAAKRFAT